MIAIFHKSKFIQTCVLAAVTAALTNQALADVPPVLHEGTPVRMRLSRNVSSATAQEGETVNFEILDEIKVGDLVIIPQGATALATVTDSKHKRTLGRAGHLNINIDYVRAASGEKIPLRGIQNNNADGHTGAMTGAMLATSIVFWPAAPLFLFMHGKDITIPKGHEVIVYVNADFQIDAGKFPQVAGVAAQPAATAKPAGKSITNDDVLSLKNAGFSDELILAKINSAPPAFKLDTEDLMALKNAGLSDAVIAAMVQVTGR